jgi:hypothetical protein
MRRLAADSRYCAATDWPTGKSVAFFPNKVGLARFARRSRAMQRPDAAHKTSRLWSCPAHLNVAPRDCCSKDASQFRLIADAWQPFFSPNANKSLNKLETTARR